MKKWLINIIMTDSTRRIDRNIKQAEEDLDSYLDCLVFVIEMDMKEVP